MTITLIGIDVATKADNIGLSLGRLRLGDGAPRLLIERATTGAELLDEAGPSQGEASVTERLATALTDWFGDVTLLGIDAPLGWPAPMGRALFEHRAGAPLSPQPEAMFNRLTDRIIHQRFRKKPLEVGADRIARTAHAALSLLDALRQATARRIDVWWTMPSAAPRARSKAGAIEVYPAATLLSRGHNLRGYKKDDEAGKKARAQLASALQAEAELGFDIAPLVEDDDQLDAAYCVLAAADFARGLCDGPGRGQKKQAQIEGWIWARGA